MSSDFSIDTYTYTSMLLNDEIQSFSPSEQGLLSDITGLFVEKLKAGQTIPAQPDAPANPPAKPKSAARISKSSKKSSDRRATSKMAPAGKEPSHRLPTPRPKPIQKELPLRLPTPPIESPLLTPIARSEPSTPLAVPPKLVVKLSTKPASSIPQVVETLFDPEKSSDSELSSVDLNSLTDDEVLRHLGKGRQVQEEKPKLKKRKKKSLKQSLVKRPKVSLEKFERIVRGSWLIVEDLEVFHYEVEWAPTTNTMSEILKRDRSAYSKLLAFQDLADRPSYAAALQAGKKEAANVQGKEKVAAVLSVEETEETGKARFSVRWHNTIVPVPKSLEKYGTWKLGTGYNVDSTGLWRFDEGVVSGRWIRERDAVEHKWIPRWMTLAEITEFDKKGHLVLDEIAKMAKEGQLSDRAEEKRIAEERRSKALKIDEGGHEPKNRKLAWILEKDVKQGQETLYKTLWCNTELYFS